MTQEITCILFSEFHLVTGPKLTYQCPEDYISKEFFDSVNNYIITKPELQSRIITVNSRGHKIIGCPVCIENKKYDRNELIFNLCFVFDSTTRTSKYEPAVKKLAGYLTQLELESAFLSDENKKAMIPQFLQELLAKLNQNGNCSLFINDSCTINLKVSPLIDDPQPLHDHEVPIFITENPRFINRQWDLTTQQVLQFIDGFNHVAKIAAEADIEINLVKACLQNLLHINIIRIISIFQYSNMYMATNWISQLVDDETLQEECLQFVASKGHMRPNFRDVFLLYSSLCPGLTIRDLCMRYNPHSLKIDEKKLIQFGLKKEIIRRIHGYPVKLPNSCRPSGKVQSISKWLNGVHCLDEISCKSGLTYKELDEICENEPSIIVNWK